MKISNLVGGTLRNCVRIGVGAANTAAATGELAVRTVAGPLGDLARLTAAAGGAVTRGVAATAPMRSGLDAFLKGLGVALARLPGARGTTLDAEELRRSFVATTTDAGATVADEFVALVEAATSAAVGDPERLRNEIERAVERMRLLAGAGDSLDVLPGTPISRRLRDRAREVVDHAPHRLLAALDGGVPDGSSRPLAVFKAMVADADKLRVFSIGYPRILATVVARVGSLLLTDSLTLAEVDAFLAGRRFELSPPATGNGNGDRRPDTGSRAAPSHQPPAEG